MIDVTAAIIERDGKYLIAQRKKGRHLEFKWEFPGGRFEEDDKSYEECLRRELKEELGIVSKIESFFDVSVHDYGDIKIRLIGYNVNGYNIKYLYGDFLLNAHEEIKWVCPKDWRNYDFAEADIPFVEKLLETR